MRLTLLTLMAYLDDVLDPDHAKEIGEKISSSPVAADLAARIKEVCRRRRISAADAFQDDPEFLSNSVAEYLDYTLSPDQIPELERKCLNSDERLAEVAACHQILTLFLGKPVEITDKTRERMYSLVEDRSAAADAVAGQALEDIPSEPLREVETSGIETASDNQPGRFQDGIPDYLKPRPLWQRLLPVATIAAVMGIWAYAIFTDSAFKWDAQQVASNESLPEALQDDGAKKQKAENEAANDQDSKENSGDSGEKTSVNQDDNATEVVEQKNNAKPIVPPPPQDTELENSSTNPKMVANGDSENKNSATTNGQENVENPPIKPAVPKQPIPQILYTSTDSVLLKRDDLKMIGGWFVLPAGEAVSAGDEFISPMPFRSTLSMKSIGLIAKADAHTRFEILGNTAAAPFGFEIQRGRMILERHTTDDDAQQEKPISIALQLGEEIWKIELTDASTICGIDVSARLPNHLEQDFDNQNLRVVLTVVQGTVKISNNNDRDEEIAPGKVVLVEPENAQDAKFTKLQSDDLSLLGEDAWVTKDVFRSTQSRRREALRFAKEFDETDSVTMTMPAVYRNPDPHISMFAVQTLALMEKPGDLVTALKTATHEETRQAAISGLRVWLPLESENRDELKKLLSQVFRPDTDQTVYDLLWGYNNADGKDPAISQELVGWLRNENVAVRELAIFHIEELTGKTYDYRPLAPVNQRDSVAARWEQHIQREGALIPK